MEDSLKHSEDKKDTVNKVLRMQQIHLCKQIFIVVYQVNDFSTAY